MILIILAILSIIYFIQIKEGMTDMEKKDLCLENCNGKFARCILEDGEYKCVCGAGYSGKNCEIEPKNIIPSKEDWLKHHFEKKKSGKNLKLGALSYPPHDHDEDPENQAILNEIQGLQTEVDELLVKIQKRNKNIQKERRFLPSEFLAWSVQMPGLLGKNYDDRQHPKPVDIHITHDDRRKLYFQGNEQKDVEQINAMSPILGPHEREGDPKASNSDDFT